jgi:hypothetical protein
LVAQVADMLAQNTSGIDLSSSGGFCMTADDEACKVFVVYARARNKGWQALQAGAVAVKSAEF